MPVINWFGDGNMIDMLLLESDADYRKSLNAVPGLTELVAKYAGKLAKEEQLVMMEFVLFALAEHSLIGKSTIERGVQFKDILGSMFSEKDLFNDEIGN
jgi:magnesium chelatase subunit I